MLTCLYIVGIIFYGRVDLSVHTSHLHPAISSSYYPVLGLNSCLPHSAVSLKLPNHFENGVKCPDWSPLAESIRHLVASAQCQWHRVTQFDEAPGRNYRCIL